MPPTMQCPRCGSDDTVVAVAGNGFGTWKCHACNSSGTYPPTERYRPPQIIRPNVGRGTGD